MHWRFAPVRTSEDQVRAFVTRPRVVGGKTPRAVSDVFDSPQRSEDYRDMFETAEGDPEGVLSPGAAGRPRAASQPAYAPPSAMPAAASLVQLSMLRACFCRGGGPGSGGKPDNAGA